MVSGATYIGIKPIDPNEVFDDLCAMQFKLEDYDIPNFEQTFFEILEPDLGMAIATFLFFGHPTELRDLDFYNETSALKQIRSTMIVTTAKYHQTSNAQGVHSITMNRTSTHSSDGLSRSPVFHL